MFLAMQPSQAERLTVGEGSACLFLPFLEQLESRVFLGSSRATISPSRIVERQFEFWDCCHYSWKLVFEGYAIPRPEMRNTGIVNHGDRSGNRLTLAGKIQLGSSKGSFALLAIVGETTVGKVSIRQD